jgi:hypothetical protein
MGTARALLSFYGVLDRPPVKKAHRWHDWTGFQKVVDRWVQINVLATHEYKASPRRKKLQNTHVRQDYPAQTLRSPV